MVELTQSFSIIELILILKQGGKEVVVEQRTRTQVISIKRLPNIDKCS